LLITKLNHELSTERFYFLDFVGQKGDSSKVFVKCLRSTLDCWLLERPIHALVSRPVPTTPIPQSAVTGGQFKHVISSSLSKNPVLNQ